MIEHRETVHWWATPSGGRVIKCGTCPREEYLSARDLTAAPSVTAAMLRLVADLLDHYADAHPNQYPAAQDTLAAAISAAPSVGH